MTAKSQSGAAVPVQPSALIPEFPDPPGSQDGVACIDLDDAPVPVGECVARALAGDGVLT